MAIHFTSELNPVGPTLKEVSIEPLGNNFISLMALVPL